MLRLILAALRYRTGATLALGALAMLAVAAGITVPLYSAAAERAAVEAVFRRALPAERSLTVDAKVPVTGSVASTLDNLLAEVRTHVPQPWLQPVTGVLASGVAYDTARPAWISAPLVARDGFCDRLTVSGRCPQQAGEVVVSSPTAKTLEGNTIRYHFPGVAEPITLRVVGVYEPAPDAQADIFWAGRTALTPLPLRANNPVFTTLETFDSAGVGSIAATVDLVIAGPEWPHDGVAVDITQTAADNAYEVANGLPALLGEVSQARQRLRISAPLGAVTILLLSYSVLLLAAGHLTRGRRTENALGLLRGAPAGHRLLVTRGPTLLVLLATAPFGAAMGWLAVRVLTWAVFDPSGPLPLTWQAIAAAAGVLVLAMVGVLAVEGAKQTGPLLESLRGVPPRRRRTGAIFDLVVAALAIAATAQAVVSGFSGGVEMVAPILAAVAIGLLATRLVRPTAQVAGAAWLRGGRLAPGLAALQLARRPGAAQVVTLVVVCTALIGHTTDAWDRTARAARDRAFAELGAEQVVTVSAPSRAMLLSAVRSADPHGDWAMAAARARLPQGRDLIAVDTTRLAATMTGRSKVDLAVLAERLRPAVNEPLLVNGAELVLDVAVTEAIGSLPVTAVLIGPDGAAVTATAEILPQVGRRDYRLAVAPCARHPGCRLAWFSFVRSPDEIRLHGLKQLGPDRTVAGGAATRSAARWRSSFELEREVTLNAGADYISLAYVPADPRYVSHDIRLQVADAPTPLPVVIAGEPSLAQTQEMANAQVFTSVDRPIEVIDALDTIAGVPAEGLLADLELADRLGDTVDNDAELQVWLGASAPEDAVERLKAAGLVIVRAEKVTDRMAADRLSGDGLGLRLQLVAAALAVGLTLLAILVLAYTDRRQRLAELIALRDQGVSGRVLSRVAHSGYLAVVLAALPVSAVACAAVWWLTAVGTGGSDSVALSSVVPPLLAAVVVLIATAWYADHRLARAVAAPGSTAEGDQ